jgi:hypothetical protein
MKPFSIAKQMTSTVPIVYRGRFRVPQKIFNGTDAGLTRLPISANCSKEAQMRRTLLALATTAGVAIAFNVGSAPASAQDISVRFGSGYGGDHWRGHAYGHRGAYWREGRHFASCRTVISERRGPIVVKKVINRC